MRGLSVFIASITLTIGCAYKTIKTEHGTRFKRAQIPKTIHDDLDLYGLRVNLKQTIESLNKAPREIMAFGPYEYSKGFYANKLGVLMSAIDKDPTSELFYKTLREEFDLLEVHTGEGWGKVFITSYYSPVIRGAVKPKGKFTEPLYALPEDSVFVNLNAYADAVPALRRAIDEKPDLFPRGRLWRGRLNQNKDKTEIVPYYSRQEIYELSLKKRMRAKVLAYVDPIDAFFLQIQGSGTVIIDKKTKIDLSYAGQNGWPYYSIGAALKDIIPLSEISQQTIEAYLRSVDKKERERILSLNPSYIFFDKNKGEPKTFMGTKPVPGRTIATDSAFYPKGALALLEYPELNDHGGGLLKHGGKTRARFVLDQDTGGAIKGPARVDLYWGRNDWAKIVAGQMKGHGTLMYFVPKL
jgi:membrane-bound lytic murein transglycosylase A